MTERDREAARRFVAFVDGLPVPDEPPMPPAASAQTLMSRSPRPVWAGVAAAVVLMVLVIAAGVVRRGQLDHPAESSTGSSLMPGRQWPWVYDISRHRIGPVLIATRLTSDGEDSFWPSQTVLRDTTGHGVATVTADGPAAISPDGRHLAIGSSRSAHVTVIDTSTGSTTDVIVPSTAEQARPIGWSRDSRRLFVAGTRPADQSGLETGEASVIDVATASLRRFPSLDGAVTVSPSPDDTHLLAALGGELRVLDARTGAIVRRIPTGGAGTLLDPDAWSDDGRWIVGVDRDRHRLIRFDFRTGDRFDLPAVAGVLHGVTWAGNHYLTLEISPPGGQAPRTATLIATDMRTGRGSVVAYWNTTTFTHDIPFDVGIARDLAQQFLR